jgi:hypothetical protein
MRDQVDQKSVKRIDMMELRSRRVLDNPIGSFGTGLDVAPPEVGEIVAATMLNATRNTTDLPTD